MTCVIVGDAIGHGASKHHLSLLGAGKGIHDERSAAFAYTHQDLGVYTRKRHVALVVIGGKTHHRDWIHVAEQGN